LEFAEQEKSGYPGSKKWLPRFKKLVTYTQDEHVPQNQTQSHPQWCFTAVGSDNRCNISNVGEINCRCLVSFWSSLNGKSGYPGSKNWLPIHRMNMCHKTKPESHPQWCFTTVGSDNCCNISNVGEINCHCLVSFWSSLNGKSGYPGSKNLLPIHSMNMCHKPKLTPTHNGALQRLVVIVAVTFQM